MNRTMLIASSIACAMFAGSAQALPTLVATIYGEYDSANGVADLPPSVTSGLTWINSGGHYDTPVLFFVNPTSTTISGAQMLLHGYGTGTFNKGISQTVSVPNLIPNSVTEVDWNGPMTAGNLFANDYDDEYPNNFGANPLGAPGSAALDCTLNAAGQHPEWFNFCAPTGNFDVTFTGTWGIQPVFSVFSPHNNATGGFVGWEGLDPNGWSENLSVDVHVGVVQGVLANIFVGTPPTNVPEPSTLAVLGTGLAGLYAARRRKKKAAPL